MKFIEAIYKINPLISHSEILSIILTKTAIEKSQEKNQYYLWEIIANVFVNFNTIITKLIIDKYGRCHKRQYQKNSIANIKLSYINEFKSSISKEIEIGQFMIGMSASKNHKKISLESALTLAKIGSMNKQYKLYFTPDGKPVGLITWAWVDQECINSAQKINSPQLHPAEWNEGRILWLRNISVNENSASEIARDLSGGLFPEIPNLYVTMHSRNLGRSLPVKFSNADRFQLSNWINNQKFTH